MHVIDLRSDTVTKPTDAMRQAMMKAEVGDDVYEDDVSVNRLQELAAEKVGKEAALFVPSGTMGNLLAVLVHCNRGGEVILGHLSHIFLYEGGGAAWIAGVHPHNLSNSLDGMICEDDIEEAIREDDIHEPPTQLVCLENTHNGCQGQPLTPEYCDRVGELVHSHGIPLHLDGARLFNAAIALDVEPPVLTRSADSVMFCLSKGLGAPIGSILCGSRKFISQARRLRKVLGGGMRQVGFMAAAGIYALEHNIDRLSVDHENARRLAEGIDAIPGLTTGPESQSQSVKTNMVYFHIDGKRFGNPPLTADELERGLRKRGVLAHREGKDPFQMRMVTNLEVKEEDIPLVLSALRDSLGIS